MSRLRASLTDGWKLLMIFVWSSDGQFFMNCGIGYQGDGVSKHIVMLLAIAIG